jgi:carbamoyltransferase
MIRYNPLISSVRSLREHNFYTLSDNLLNLISDRKLGNYTLINHDKKNFPKIYHINHHLSHAANGYFLSNFKSASILTCDFRGENESTTFNYGENNLITKFESHNTPNSLGKLYATFTELLGYRSDSDEWKVMAMSAYSFDCKEEIKKIKKCYTLSEKGKFELVSKYFEYSNLGNNNSHYTKEMLDLFNIDKVTYNSKPSKKQIKIAKALQICSEQIGLHFLDHLYNLTKNKNLVVSGGFFLNTVFNGKIINKSKFEKLYVPYAPSDTGNSIGSALYLNNNILKNRRVKINNTPFIGSSFSKDDILRSVKKRKIKFEFVENYHRYVAVKSYENKIIGFFNGKIEFGDRALGSRSILGNPTSKKIKDLINSSIKYRENYRPFAPSVIEEEFEKYFYTDGIKQNNYMERVFRIKEKYIDKLPGIAHLDNSARVQTVNKTTNPDFYKILQEFKKISGYPILLNTSFNINGEPIVYSPDDAINTFLIPV